MDDLIARRNLKGLGQGVRRCRLSAFHAVVFWFLQLQSPLDATTWATNTNTVAPTLNVSATVQTAVELTLATGTSGCAISAGGGGDYNMSFGNVNGLAVGSATCGVAPTVSGSNAIYATTYNLTASFSGFTTYSNAAVVVTTPGFTHSSILSLGEASTTAGPFTVIPSSGNTVKITTTTSGTVVNRAMSLSVANTNGGGAYTGSDTALVTFTLTVQ